MKPLLYRKRVEERANRWQLYLISDDEQHYAYLNEIKKIREWLANEMDRYTVVNIEVEQVGETITLRVIGRETNGLEIDDEIKCFSFGLSALHFVEGTKQIQALYMETLGYIHEKTPDNARVYRNVKNLVADKFYTESAHFIYELIQNANDAGAKNITFRLYPECIVIFHDALKHGGRCFDVTHPGFKGAQIVEQEHRQDTTRGCINAISSLSESNKSGDSYIGHFGVGFKSVFSFTRHPQIFEGDISFELPDLLGIRLCTVPDNGVKHLVDKGYTVFRLPFDKLTPDESKQKIRKKFGTLQNPCLFLNNLERVAFEDDETKTRKVFSFARSEIPHRAENSVRLLNSSSQVEGMAESYIMGYRQCPIVINGSYHEVELKIALRYQLSGNSLKWTSINNAPTYCYFATEENSQLKFLIHAPFNLNSNREGLLDDDGTNQYLLQKLAELVCDTFIAISKNDAQSIPLVINDTIMNIVPQKRELRNAGNIDYNVFYDSVLNVFREKRILPTIKPKEYVSVENAYWAIKKTIQEVFTDQELKKWRSEARWCFPSVPREGGCYEWIKHLFEQNYKEHQIGYNWPNNDEVLGSVVPTATDEWLQSLYKLIIDSRRECDWKTSKIWRTRAGRGKEVSAETPNVYVLPKGAEYDNADFHLITVSDAAAELATKLGIPKFNLKEVEKKKVKDNIFPLYGENDAILNISEEKHREHWKKITSIRNWQEEFCDELKQLRIFRVKMCDGPSYEQASKIRFFSSSGLFDLFKMAGIADVAFLDDAFYGDLKEDIKHYLTDQNTQHSPKEEVTRWSVYRGVFEKCECSILQWEAGFFEVGKGERYHRYLYANCLYKLESIIEFIIDTNRDVTQRKKCSIELMKQLGRVHHLEFQLIFDRAQLDWKDDRKEGAPYPNPPNGTQIANPVGLLLLKKNWLFIGENCDARNPENVNVSQLKDAGYAEIPDHIVRKLEISRVGVDSRVQELEFEVKQLREKLDAYTHEVPLETRTKEQRERDLEKLRSLSQTKVDSSVDESSELSRAHVRERGEDKAIINKGERSPKQPEIDTSVKFNEMSFADARRMMLRSVSCLVPLENKRVLRTRNNPTGDFGEWTVCKALNLQMMKAGQAGYDAKDADGNKYQIKSVRIAPLQRIESVQLSAVREQRGEDGFDCLICLVFNNDYDVYLVFKFDKEYIKRLVDANQIEYVEYTNSYRMTLGKLFSAGEASLFDITEEFLKKIERDV